VNAKEKPWYPVVYMFVLTAVLSAVLIGFSNATRDRVAAGQRQAFERAVLEALAVPTPTRMSAVELTRIYQQCIREPDNDSAGAYRYVRDGQLAGYALPIEGKGFWDVIAGVLGLGPDGATVLGISFYQQSETPGLGAEIVKPEFRGQFPGKRLADAAPALGIRRPGEPVDEHAVHGVTGATQTSTRLQKIIADSVAAWQARRTGKEAAP